MLSYHINNTPQRHLAEENVINTSKNKPEKFFQERTSTHIASVKKFALQLANEFLELAELADIIMAHDESKYHEPEYTPYLYITWSYKCKKEGIPFEVPAIISARMHEATTHHVLNNKHHPEYWSPETQDVINRDTAAQLINATKMPPVYIAEMIADWSAMSVEHNEPGPYKWAKDNINVRWKFTDEQIKMIYEYIDFLWKAQ